MTLSDTRTSTLGNDNRTLHLQMKISRLVVPKGAKFRENDYRLNNINEYCIYDNVYGVKVCFKQKYAKWVIRLSSQ